MALFPLSGVLRGVSTCDVYERLKAQGMRHEERQDESSICFCLKSQASGLKPGNSYASVKTLVRPCSEEKLLISELETHLGFAFIFEWVRTGCLK